MSQSDLDDDSSVKIASHDSQSDNDVSASQELGEHLDEMTALEPGAATRKMQQLAIDIYESTPKIVECKSF